MKIFICDPGLFSKGSHSYNATLELIAGFEHCGVCSKVFAYSRADPEIIVDTWATPYFTHQLYEKHCSVRPFNEELNWREINESFRSDMERLGPEIARPDAIVLVPAVTQHQIEGLANWYAALKEDKRPKLAVALMFFPQWTAWGDRAVRGTEYYARAIEKLRPWIGRSVLLYTESPELQSYFERLADTSVHVLPIARSILLQRHRAGDVNRTRFGYFGHTRSEKGFHLLPEAVDFCHAEGLPFDLVVQIQHNDFEEETIMADRLLRLKPHVRSIIGSMERNCYYETLDRCDVILLPYNPTMFRARGSGCFADALTYGKPIIATLGTAMAKAAERGECVACLCEFNSADLARAMIDFQRNRSELIAKAAQIGCTWYEANNADVFCRRILEFANSSIPMRTAW